MRRTLLVVAAEREEVMMVVVTVAGSQVERRVDRPSVVRERLEAFAGDCTQAMFSRMPRTGAYDVCAVAMKFEGSDTVVPSEGQM